MRTDGKRNNLALQEVVYVSPDDEKRQPQFLKAEDEPKKTDSAFLYLSCISVNLLMFACGCNFAWSSPVFPVLKQSDPDLNPLGQVITPGQESWVASLLSLGAAIGPLFAGIPADRLGRKKTLIIVAVPVIAAYFTLAFATNITLYYVFRFVTGLGVGSAFAIIPIYLGEISEVHNRGKYGCSMTAFALLGQFYPYVSGPLLSLKMFNISCAIPLALFLISFTLFIPETPVYLASAGERERAEKALMQLRNKTRTEVQTDLQDIAKQLESTSKGNAADIFKTKGTRRAFAVSVALVMLQQFGGINALLAFLGPIFQATGSSISPYISTVLVSVIQVVCCLFTSFIVDKVGRRLLLLVSASGSAASIILLGIYFYLKNNTVYNVDGIFWLPIACLIVYMITFNLGLGPIPWAVMGEIFPSNIKSVASALTAAICFASSFLTTLGFPLIVESLGTEYCFWIFGGCCIAGLIFVYFVVPETKGKSVRAIQELLNAS